MTLVVRKFLKLESQEKCFLRSLETYLGQKLSLP
jgi:hypothetical protein